MGEQRKLTKKQAMTLRLLNLGFSVAEIAKRRKVKPQTIYNMLYRLEARGVLNLSEYKRGGVVCVKSPNLRLHALQYQIKILYQSPVYKKTKKNHNIISFGDFKVALFSNSLTLWILRDFIGVNSSECQREASEYLYKTLYFLERKYNLILVKRGYQNIKEVRSHYAQMNNSLADKAIRNNQPIQIKGREDGKVWLSADLSINPPELETTHKDTAFEDMHDIIEPFFSVLKENPYFFNELLHETRRTAKISTINSAHIKKMQESFKAFADAIKSRAQEQPQPPEPPEPLDPGRPDYIQ